MISTFFSLLDSCFLRVIEISLHASILIAVLITLRPVIKSFLPPRWVYALWFVLIARLMLVEVPSWQSVGNPVLEVPLKVVQSLSLNDAPLSRIVSTSAPAEALSGSSAFTWTETLALFWLAGAVFLLARISVENFRWLNRLAKAPDVTAPEIIDLLEECGQEMGVRSVRLVQLSGFASPSMTGLFRPVIVLPDDFLQHFKPAELRWILLHEMTHYKRGDLFVQLLCQILQAVHWFNPFVWYAFSSMRTDRELACDASVLDRQIRATTRDYGHTLIKVAETYPRSFLAPGFLGVTEDKTDLHERVIKISSHRRPGLTWIISGIILCTLLALFFLTNATSAPPHQATAKIQVFTSTNGLPAEIEVIQSIDIIVPTIVRLGLDKTWAKRFSPGESALSPAEIMDHFAPMLTVKQTDPNGNIVYITVQDDSPKEAADIANAIVQEYAVRKKAREIQVYTDGAHSQYDSTIAKDESTLNKAKEQLAKIDPTSPNASGIIGNAQDAVNHAQYALDQHTSQLNDELTQAKGLPDSVRILAPAY
jgi:beta-lactamase regulating signal transducer with metallopeptidase domain